MKKQASIVCAMAGIGLIAHAELITLNPTLAVVSSTFNDWAITGDAFDGASNTRWASALGTENEWIYIDLQEDYMLSQVTIDWETGHSADYTLRVRTAEQGVDNNPANWTEVASVTGRSGIDGWYGTVDDTFNFDTSTFTANSGSASSSTVVSKPVGRYLMMSATKRATQYGHSIWEMTVHGTVPPPAGTLIIIL